MSWADIRVSVFLEKVLNLPEIFLIWSTSVSVFFFSVDFMSCAHNIL